MSKVAEQTKRWAIERIGRPRWDSIEWLPFSSPVGVVRACIACEDTQPKEPVLVVQGYQLSMCNACGTHEFSPHPNLQDEPTNDVAIKYYVELGAGLESLSSYILTAVGTKTEGSFLDVGCGFGFAVDIARRGLDWKAIGVEPSYFGAAGASYLGADIRRCFLNEAGVAPKSFEAVLCSEVLEHVDSPVDLLQQVWGCVSSSGRLVTTTPSVDYIYTAASEGQLLALLSPGSHVYFPSEGGLLRIFERAGVPRPQVVDIGMSLVCVVDAPLFGQEAGPAVQAGDKAPAAERSARGKMSKWLSIKPNVEKAPEVRKAAEFTLATPQAAETLERRYLSAFGESQNCDPMVKSAMLGRLFNRFVRTGDYAGAQHVLVPLGETIANAESASLHLDTINSLQGVADRIPFYAAQLLHDLAMYHLNHLADPMRAAQLFERAMLVSKAFIRIEPAYFGTEVDRASSALFHAALGYSRGGENKRALELLRMLETNSSPRPSDYWLERAQQAREAMGAHAA